MSVDLRIQKSERICFERPKESEQRENEINEDAILVEKKKQIIGADFCLSAKKSSQEMSRSTEKSFQLSYSKAFFRNVSENSERLKSPSIKIGSTGDVPVSCAAVKLEQEVIPEENSEEGVTIEVNTNMNHKMLSDQEGRSQYHSILRLSVPSITVTDTSTESLKSSKIGPVSRRSSQNTSPPVYDYSCRNLTSTPGYLENIGNYSSYVSSKSDNAEDSVRYLNVTTAKRGTVWTPNVDCNYQPNRSTLSSAKNLEDRMSYGQYSDESGNEDSLVRSAAELSPSTNEYNFSDEDELLNDSSGAIADSLVHCTNSEKAFMKMRSFGDDTVSDSDQESLDDVVEAKRARMEAIVSNMRLPSADKTVPKINNVAVTDRRIHNESRRPKRKRYTPKQHDSRSDMMEEVNSFMLTGGKGIIEKIALQQQLQQLQDQLAEMKHKYSKLLGVRNFDSHDTSLDNNYGEGLRQFRNIERNMDHGETFPPTIQTKASCQITNKHLIENGLIRDSQNGHRGSQKANTEADVERLAVMLREEIATGVGSLVDEIVKKFEERHQLQSDQHPIVKRESQSVSPVVPEESDSTVHSSQLKRNGVPNQKVVCTRKKVITPPSKAFCGQPVASTSFPQQHKPPLTQMLNRFPDYSLINRFDFLPKSIDNINTEPNKFSHAFFTPNTYSCHEFKPTTFDMSLRPAIPLFFPIHNPTAPLATGSIGSPGATNFLLNTATTDSQFSSKEPEQTEALPLVVSLPIKKKKVPTATLR